MVFARLMCSWLITLVVKHCYIISCCFSFWFSSFFLCLCTTQHKLLRLLLDEHWQEMTHRIRDGHKYGSIYIYNWKMEWHSKQEKQIFIRMRTRESKSNIHCNIKKDKVTWREKKPTFLCISKSILQ